MGQVLGLDAVDPSTLFKVTPSTPPKQLAEMIVRALLEVEEVTLSCVGNEGVARATKANIAAAQMLSVHGVGMCPFPYWATVEGSRRLPSGEMEPISAIFFKCVRVPFVDRFAEHAELGRGLAH